MCIRDRCTITWHHSVRKEKVRFKGIPKNVPLQFNNQVFEKLDFAFFRRVINALNLHEQYELDEEFPAPMASISSMNRVGYRATSQDMASGSRPFSLQPVTISRSMLANPYSGRRVWDLTDAGGDSTGAVQNLSLIHI